MKYREPKTKGSLTAMGGFILLGLFVVVLASSCYWNPLSGSGKLTLDLRSISRSQVGAGLDIAHVYLYSDNMNSRVNIGDGTPYAEVPISGDSVTINNIPAGEGYKLVVTFGTKQSGVFVPQQYAWTDGQSTFNVTAGSQTTVSLTGKVTTVAATLAQMSPNYTPNFQYDLLGKNLVDVANDGSGYVVAATSSTAYFGSANAPSTFQSVSPGVTINSVSHGTFPGATAPYSEYLLNTSAGIKEYSFSGGTVAQGSNLPSGGPTGNVYDSQVFYSSVSGDSYVYAENGTGLAGAQCTFGTGLPLSGQWIEVPFPRSVDRPVLDASFSDYTQSPITYIAAGGGTFGILSPQFLTSNNPDFSYVLNYGGFMTQGNLTIKSLVADNLGSLYLGTSSGVYKGSTSSIDTLAKNVVTGGSGGTTAFNGSLVSLTGDHPIRRVLSQSSMVAALSNNLLIISDGTTSVELPLPAVALGDVNGITINPNEAFVILAGTEGLTYVALNSIGF